MSGYVLFTVQLHWPSEQYMHVSSALKCTGFASRIAPFESYSTTVVHAVGKVYKYRY